MKYIKIYENTAVINNSMVQFTSKNDKLDVIKDEINVILSNMSDKKIGYNYAVGSKGIFFTTATGELISENGFGCTTYSELMSNLEVILFTLKNINDHAISSTENPIQILRPEEPSNDVAPEPQQSIPAEQPVAMAGVAAGTPVILPVVGEEIERFESFKSKIN